jgi:hypothetical protein
MTKPTRRSGNWYGVVLGVITVAIAIIVLGVYFTLSGCAARQPLRSVGAPPNSNGQCMNNHYKLNPLTGHCELSKDQK